MPSFSSEAKEAGLCHENASNCVRIFPSNEQEIQESKDQPTPYIAFHTDFKKLILEKEQAGLLYWLKPDCDYSKVSKFFESIMDPITGQYYQPLLLDDNWWKNEFKKVKHKNTSSGTRVMINYQTGDHDYSSVIELLYQSNPTLEPMLQWSDKVSLSL